MYEPEKILVQNAGIDPGVAALLQNAITGGFNNLMTDNASKFNVIGAKIDAQTQMINDKFCQLEMREMQNKIDTLRAEKSALIGLTVATNKEEIANMVRQNYNEFKAKKEAASKYDEEMEKCKDILDQLEAQVEIPTVTNTVDNSKEINDLKNDVADIRKMIEDAKKMFMGGFPKPPMPPMPNVPAPQMK